MGHHPSILFVNNFATGMGGGEVLVLRVISACVAAGWDVCIVCPPGAMLGTRAASLGADVIEHEMDPVRIPRLMRSLRLLARRVDIVEGTGFLTNVLVRVAVMHGSSQVVNLVQVDPGAHLASGESLVTSWFRRVIDVLTRRQVGVFIAVSDGIAARLVADGVSPERIAVVHNGVDPADLQQQALQACPPALPPGTGPLIGCIARLERVKGVDLFIEAAALVARVEPSARFVIRGDGSQSDALRASIPVDLRGRLEFIDEVATTAPLLAALDVLVLPSRSEGLPTVLLEAGALGVPVVATRVGGVAEVVLDDQTGILVDAEDPDSISKAVLELLRCPTRARRMGDAARRRVCERFSVEQMGAQTLRVYSRLLRLDGKA